MSGHYLQEGQVIRIELPLRETSDRPQISFPVTVGKIYSNSFLVKASADHNLATDLETGLMLNLFIGATGSLFSAQSQVLDIESDPYFLIELSKPDRFKRIEMRHWVRVPVDLQLRYRLAHYEWPFYEANTINVSGGGVLFMAKHIVDEDLELELDLNLPGNHAVDGLASVTRCVCQDTFWGERYHIACRFQDIQEKAREALISFVFQKQRDIIKKGSLQGVY